MTGDELARAVPRLFHMAHENSWPSVREHGLLSTSALLERFEVNGRERDTIDSTHRPESVVITHPALGQAVVRDQKPMSDDALRRCLDDGMEPSDWYRHLNERVFFWATRQRLLTMVGARAYRDLPQTVLTIDTEAFVERYEDRIAISTMNTGNTFPFPFPRGRNTFVPLRQFDYDASRKKRGRNRALAEVVVPHSVPDIADLVVTVERWVDGHASETLFER